MTTPPSDPRTRWSGCSLALPCGRRSTCKPATLATSRIRRAGCEFEAKCRESALSTARRDEGNGAKRASRATADLHRQGDDPRAHLGQLIEVGEIFQSGDAGRAGDPVHDEVLRRSMVDGRGVEPQRADVALADEVLGGFLSVAGEVQLRGIARRVITQVLLAVGPALSPPGPEQHDRALRDGSVSLLPAAHVVQ